ncbi:MAG: hypothetical protein UFJ18_02960 [Blautia sp.]|nr:hypothetical protein [Blautia sp.]
MYPRGIEFIIYIYMLICVSLIGYNVVSMLDKKQKDKRYKKRCSEIKEIFEKQLYCLEQGNILTEKEQDKFVKKLCRVEYLMAFEQVLTEELEAGRNLEIYFENYRRSTQQLCAHYQNKEDMQKAYMAYVLSYCHVKNTQENTVAIEFLLNMLGNKNIYCRENALYTLYSVGDEELLIEGLRRLNASPYFHYSKLLTEGLLTFRGDYHKLIDGLWEIWEEWKVEIQVAILNYIRFKTGGYEDKMYQLLRDERQNEEIHYSAIRYLGKYAYIPVYPLFLAFLEEKGERWNYAAIAASALASYPGESTIHNLKKALGNANWYVRYNAAQSLMNLGVRESDLSDVLNGKDRFAKEMLEFCLEEQGHRRKRV